MAETPADPPEPESASRVIIVAPFGADMAVLDRIVAAHGLRPVTAPAENGALEERLAAGWDILVLTAEACRPRILSCVAARLLDLPVWSAPPVVILSETDSAGRKAAGLLREARRRGHVVHEEAHEGGEGVGALSRHLLLLEEGGEDAKRLERFGHLASVAPRRVMQLTARRATTREV